MNTRDVQAALLSLGYDPGPVDGLPGKKTTAAVIAFQKAAGLYPDGIAGPKTWLALEAGRANDNAAAPAPARQAMSAIGIAVLIGREACKLTAYPDTKGIWTIGIGHTAAAGAPIPYRGLSITGPSATRSSPATSSSMRMRSGAQ